MLIKTEKKQSIDQLTVAKVVASRLGLDLNTVISVVELEQKTTMSYVKRGYKITKKNYLTIEPKLKDGYTFNSGIDGKEYQVPERVRLLIRAGEGFKNYVNEDNRMKNLLCRFIDGN
jgi:hypothetical protein